MIHLKNYFILSLILHFLLKTTNVVLCDSKESAILSVVHVTSLFHWNRGKLTVASVIENIPDGNYLKDYFIVTAKKAIDLDYDKFQQNISSNSSLCFSKHTTKFDIRCVDEITLLNQTRRDFYKSMRLGSQNDTAHVPKHVTNHPTWAFQMVLKIYASRLVSTRFFLTLDSDVLLLRPLTDIEWILPSKKARVAGALMSYHKSWYTSSDKFLRANGCQLNKTLGIGVTPAVLHTNTMLSIISRIEYLYGGPQKAFMRAIKGGFTEYSAYLTQSCVRGDFEEHHTYIGKAGSPSLYGGFWGNWQHGLWKRTVSSTKNTENFLTKYVFVVIQDHGNFGDADVSKFVDGRIGRPGFMTV